MFSLLHLTKICKGGNQWPLEFDKECSFDLSDCEEEEGFVVRIKKTRWMRRSKVLLTSVMSHHPFWILFQMKLWAYSIWVREVRILKVDSSGSKQFSRKASPAQNGSLSTRMVTLTPDSLDYIVMQLPVCNQLHLIYTIEFLFCNKCYCSEYIWSNIYMNQCIRRAKYRKYIIL